MNEIFLQLLCSNLIQRWSAVGGLANGLQVGSYSVGQGCPLNSVWKDSAQLPVTFLDFFWLSHKGGEYKDNAD